MLPGRSATHQFNDRPCLQFNKLGTWLANHYWDAIATLQIREDCRNGATKSLLIWTDDYLFSLRSLYLFSNNEGRLKGPIYLVNVHSRFLLIT